MPTFQFLPSIRDSETIVCQGCKTRQYPRNGSCIRCHRSLTVDYVCLQIGTLPDSQMEDRSRQLACWIGELLRILRKRSGICQSQLANVADIDRSYLSKAENGLVLLPLGKLFLLVKALGLTEVILRFEAANLGAIPRSYRCY